MLTHFIEGVQAKIRMDSEGDTSSRITFFPNISKDVREVIRHQKFLFDPLYLRLVFVNFFNNSYHSIKKNGVGVIAFDVELEHSKADALTLSFKISDNGPGFDRSFDNLGYDEVFKGRERQKIERNGAGVARSHAVLAKMKSKLFFSSTKGEGASASFSMTFRKSKEKNPAQFSLRPAAGLYPLVEKAVKSAFRALVVDDQAINAKLIVRSFKNMNYSCDMASGGEEAIALCKKHSYQLIFMDYQMPGLNGLQTAERILCDQEGKNQETSIYGLSGNYDLELEQECLSKGMKGLLSKPLKPSVFRQIVAKITKVAELSPSISPFLEQVGVQRLPKLPSFSEEERKESPFPQFVGNRYAIPNFPNKRGMLPPGVVAPRAKKPSISFLPNTTQFPSYSDSPIPSQSEQKDFNSPPSLLDEKKKERKKAPNPCCTVQ